MIKPPRRRGDQRGRAPQRWTLPTKRKTAAQGERSLLRKRKRRERGTRAVHAP